MRVALVSPYSLSVPGGVQGQVLGLARALRALGHDAVVLGPVDGPAPPGVTAVGGSVALPANGSVAPIALAPSAAARTVRALGRGDFDVVHLHEPLVPGPCLASLVASPRPLIGTFHAAGTSASYRWAGRVLGRLAQRLGRRCAVSAEAAALARRHLGGRYDLVPNGVEVARFADVDPWPTDAPTVVFVGRHEPRKGLAVLVAALPELPAQAQVWVVGEGPQTARLRAACAGDSRVRWLGRLGDDELLRRLAGAHVLCAPSLGGESFGMVLLEAMAAGTAVVASDIAGYAAVARPDREAVLVPPGDARALGAALRRVLTEPDLAATLVAAGARRAEELSSERMAERYLERYAALALSPARGVNRWPGR
ncbi:MAG: glycosyltransferase family 4 protein [Actinomycetota bacterium]|nr:glycosyltransferase family 4 protein [Actinomycetota bacterium]